MNVRKQTAYHQTFTATMSFAPTKVGYEAGIVLWWNQFSHATVGVTRTKVAGGPAATTVVRRSPTGRAGAINVCDMLSKAYKPTTDSMVDLISPLEQRGASGKGSGGPRC